MNLNIISILPHLQAILNFTAICLMTMAYYRIHVHHDKQGHISYMIAALVVSAIFLLSYLTYHFQVGNVKFAGEGLIRPLYFSILISHVLLAALIVPLIIMMLRHAIHGSFGKHRQLGRWTLPLWLYVSFSGVVVYLLAFQIYSPSL